MVDDAWLEVRNTAEAILSHLKVVAEHKPDAVVEPADFNALLERAKAAFPSSGAIRDMKPASGVMSVSDLLVKVSIISGATKAAFTSRNLRAAEEHNRRLPNSY
jgi:hypothetical protein